MVVVEMDCLKLQQKCDALVACIREKDEEISKLKEELSILNQSVPSIDDPFLPPEVLSIIFGHLDTQSLVEVVDVSKAWREIACNDKKLWLNVNLTLDSVENSLSVARTLCKAPLVGFLELHTEVLRKCPHSVLRILVYRSCPVCYLSIFGNNDIPPCLLLFLNRQALSLHPGMVDICGVGQAGRAELVEELWDTIARMNMVAFSINDFIDNDVKKTKPVLLSSNYKVPLEWGQRMAGLRLHTASSLGKLGSVVESMVESIIGEQIRFLYLPPQCPAHLIGLLGGCPNLEHVGIPAVKEIVVLKSCAGITSLELYGVKDKDEHLHVVVDFILNIKSLEELTLENIGHSQEHLNAIANSMSALREFSMVDMVGAEEVTLNDVLRAQTQLRKLCFEGAIAKELLVAITPEISPNLEVVDITTTCKCCSDDSCFLRAWEELKGKYPQIHWKGEVRCRRNVSDVSESD